MSSQPKCQEVHDPQKRLPITTENYENEEKKNELSECRSTARTENVKCRQEKERRIYSVPVLLSIPITHRGVSIPPLLQDKHQLLKTHSCSRAKPINLKPHCIQPYRRQILDMTRQRLLQEPWKYLLKPTTSSEKDITQTLLWKPICAKSLWIQNTINKIAKLGALWRQARNVWVDYGC